jgi:hypothetical protein
MAIVLIVVAVVIGGGIAGSFALRSAQPPKPVHASTRPPAPPASAPIVDAPPAEEPPDAAPIQPARAPGHGSAPPRPAAGKAEGCAGVRAAVLQLLEHRMEDSGGDRTMAARIADAHAAHCVSDHWAPGAAACLAAAKTEYAARECAEKLSNDQQWRLAGDISPLAMGALKEPQATASEHPDPACASAAGHAVDAFVASTSQLIDLISADRRPAARAHFAKVAPFLKTGVTRVCSDDKWPADTITCLDGAHSDHEMGRCARQLPDAQRAHLEKAIAAAVGTPDHFP